MGTSTWAQIGSGSGIVTAVGGAFGALGEVFDSETLTDIGGIAASIGQLGVQVATTGAFATAGAAEQTAALVAGSPIVTAVNAGMIGQQVQKQQQTPAPQPTAPNQQSMAPAGENPLMSLLLLPIRILQQLLGALGGGGARQG